MNLSDCDCPECQSRRERLWAWLEAEPGPYFFIQTCLLALAFGLALAFMPY